MLLAIAVAGGPANIAYAAGGSGGMDADGQPGGQGGSGFTGQAGTDGISDRWGTGGGGGAAGGGNGGNGGNGSLYSGTGGAGGSSPSARGGDGSDSDGGGGGGAGGSNGNGAGASSIINLAPSSGGDGGDGGSESPVSHNGAGGGGGGAGGYGAIITGAGSTGDSSTTSAITGGTGGDGGGGNTGGAGGAGGIGVYFSASGSTFTLQGTSVSGGQGGAGGFGGIPSAAGGTGGNGGEGGAGISLSGGAIHNEGGSVSGGAGGFAGIVDFGFGGNAGAGGAGVAGSDVSVVNSGSIAGGLGGDGVTRADAITFTGGRNSLTLQAGSQITGNVIVDTNAGATGALVLGGVTSAVFDASAIGSQYQGFSSFQKIGTSIWTLIGTTADVTPWSINAGGLSISSDANLGAASGGLTLNGGALQTTGTIDTSRAITLGAGGGTILPDSHTTLTLDGNINGSGGLTVGGEGTVILTGTNSYAGGTTVGTDPLNGTTFLQLGTGGLKTTILGAITNNGILKVVNADLAGVTTIDNNLLVNFGNNTSAATSTINNFAQVIFDQNSSAGSANITNMGALEFLGASTAANATINNVGLAVLFLDSSTAGDATIVSDGAMGQGMGLVVFQGESSAGTSAITVKNGGSVVFGNQATPGDADLIAENGYFDISNTLGANSDGVVTAGSISGAADGAFYLGDNEFVVGSNGKSTEFAGLLSDGSFQSCGCGALTGAALTKVGTGTLTLSGTGTYTGGTLVSAGKLVVNGTFAGPVDVDSSATLGGTGTIGDTMIASGGIVAPGNSPGTLHVSGDLLLSPGSIYDAEIRSNGVADQITVTGTATVTGSHAQVATLDPETSYKNGQSYTILTAKGGVNGTFADVLSHSAFLDFTLASKPNAVDLTIGLKNHPGNPPSFQTVANTHNQKATAGALDTLQQSGSSLALYNDLLMLDAPSARAAFDALSGEIHASIKTGLIDDSHFVRDAANERLRAAFDGVATDNAAPVLAYGPDGAKALAPADTSRFAAWGSAFGSWSDYDSDGNASGMDSSTGGFVTGLDGLVADTWRLGLLAGYGHSSFHVDDRNSSGESDNYHLGVYGGTQWSSLSFRSGLAYSWHSIDTSRQVAFPGFEDRLTGDDNAGTLQAFGELGYRIDTAMASFEPFANLAHVRLHTKSFDEDGGAAALSVNGGNTDTTFTTLGVRASTALNLGSVETTARGTLGWKHAFGDTTPLSTQAFAGSNAFTIAGVPIAEDSAVIEAGLDFNLSKTATLGIAYNGQFGSGNQQNGLNATFGVKF